jgi:hypothetical protein
MKCLRVAIIVLLMSWCVSAQAQTAATIPAVNNQGDTAICVSMVTPTQQTVLQSCFEINPTDTANIFTAYGSPCGPQCAPADIFALIGGQLQSDVTNFATSYLQGQAQAAAQAQVTAPTLAVLPVAQVATPPTSPPIVQPVPAKQ